MKGGDIRQIACLQFGCCCLHEEMGRYTQDEQHAIFTHQLHSEVHSEIFEHLLSTVINVLFMCNKFPHLNTKLKLK